MVGKAFFLFPGQGAQYPGMALDFLSSGSAAVKSLFDCASEICGKDMKALLESEVDVLKRTDVSQPVITLTNLAAAAYLAEKGGSPAGCAGFSLGEYAALAAAGVITKEDCFLLVNQRGKAMQVSVDEMEARGKSADGKNVPGMAAVMGLEPEKVESLIAEWKAGGNTAIQEIYAANINSPKQTVVGGTAEALAEAEALFTAAGAKRYIRLQVNCPFHTPLLAGAAERFKPFLEGVAFHAPQVPVFSNVSGKRVSSAEEAKKMALAQITNPVRWFDETQAIAALGGIDCLLEVGPGKVLQGLWKDSGSDLVCHAAGTVADIDKLFE
ncbi:MAG: ACP S-malonyltransferase [Treponema sp.]|nr:ACP S-malonyltransferase [Treponema sp.]